MQKSMYLCTPQLGNISQTSEQVLKGRKRFLIFFFVIKKEFVSLHPAKQD